MIAHHLPAQIHAFVGRKQELAAIAERLFNPNCRLLTIVGPGGIGKTQLAIEVCRMIAEGKNGYHHLFRDGVYFVPLQALISSDFNFSALSDSLGLQFSPDENPEEQLLRYLRPKSTLLVFDNFEHLLDGTSLISRLLETAPHIKVLATSRQTLNLREEWVYLLDGMHYPTSENGRMAEDYDAIQFFASSALQVHPAFNLEKDYASVKRICQLVEGMPLALELAASWVRVLSTEEIVNEITQGLDILETRMTNTPERHRNMRAVLDASWNHLTQNEQDTFKKLSVFRGGFRREAAQIIADASHRTLASLVDKSWLRHDTTGRYDVHELLRQYGEEQLNLNRAEAEQVHDQHCHYYCNYLGERHRDLGGNRSGVIREELETEIDNIRSCWDWAVNQRKDEDIAIAIDALWAFYDSGKRFHEGEQAFAKAVKALRANSDKADLNGNATLLGKALMYQANDCESIERVEDARRLFRESLVVLEHANSHIDYFSCLIQLAMNILHFQHDVSQAREKLEFAFKLCNQVGVPEVQWSIIASMGCCYECEGQIYECEGQIEEAHRYYQQSLALISEVDMPQIVADLCCDASRSAFRTGRYSEAYDYALRSLKFYQDSGIMWGIARVHNCLSFATWGLKRYDETRDHILTALSIGTEHKLYRLVIDSLAETARLWSVQGKPIRAVEILHVRSRSGVECFPSDKNEQIARLKSQLPADVFEAAAKRGQALDIDIAVQEVLVELKAQDQTSPLRENTLTSRELEILQLVAKGMSNQAIATELYLAQSSVKWYIHEILSKMDASNRTQAVVKARELNLLSN